MLWKHMLYEGGSASDCPLCLPLRHPGQDMSVFKYINQLKTHNSDSAIEDLFNQNLDNLTVANESSSMEGTSLVVVHVADVRTATVHQLLHPFHLKPTKVVCGEFLTISAPNIACFCRQSWDWY